ncbi:conserved hypothetical protein [Sporisorium reilianum SRZ2]|uniref:Uncharacterized protein n=1 Tax=Sporisorium reilianum (strain SRZ2) TaxID=999809 RepID=E6ZM47_SPORE|nr:conserved hypothetical protein [Sporisorium reilianum SRZ2]
MSDSTNQNKGEEQSFTIQPHPATSDNDPALNTGLKEGVFGGGKPGPAVVNAEKLEEPLSREELAKRSAELNK